MSPLLANQIAAGEVVERPASIVKELLENSLDAGAKHIQIDLEGGGMDLIKIRDDGSGIDKEDLSLALCRHATSKIYSIDDLQQISSLGFRGEALASIAAVTQFSLTSRTMNSEHAWRINSNDMARDFDVEPAAHPCGSTVEARNIFYNTPARRKFLRSEKTELGHIETIIKQIALCRHDVQLTLRHKNVVLLHARSNETGIQSSARVAAICGQFFVDNAITLDSDDGVIALRGWLGTEQTARSQNDLQYFYVNGRIVRDKLINHAIRMAYQDYLYEGKQPAYVLYLTLPHNLVDVNVHPTKHEVRFYESRQVHDFIVFHIQRALSGASPAVALETVEYTATTASNYAHTSYQNKPNNVWTQLAVHETATPFIAERIQVNNAVRMTEPNKNVSPHHALPHSLGQLIGLLHQQYVMLTAPQGLTLIHIQRAKQAIAYAALMHASIESPLISQPLLLPTSITLTVSVSEQVEHEMEQFAMLGIKLARLAEQRWVVRELPAVLKHANIEAGLIALCERTTPWSQAVISETLASYADTRTEFTLSEKEQTELIAAVSQLPEQTQRLFKPNRFISLDELAHLF
jgi:DNA mismatch repair protein MutL